MSSARAAVPSVSAPATEPIARPVTVRVAHDEFREPFVEIFVQPVFDRCYDAGPYLREIDYAVDEVIPPLDPDQNAWVKGILHARQN